jgi:hypothetical protein
VTKLTFLLFLILNTTTCFTQTNDVYEPFKPPDYPTDKFQIQIDTATFSKFKIEVIQVILLDLSYWSECSFYCRAWFTLSQGNKVIYQYFYKSMEPVGGCAGIFIPDNQPRNDFFIFSKFGDYDGHILIIDSTGKLIEKLGGAFYISKSKRYLFSNYDSDYAGLTVYDLDKQLILYSALEESRVYFDDWYFQNKKYIAKVYDDVDNEDREMIKIATFDFKTKKLVFSSVNKTFLKSENLLKVYNKCE